MSGQEPAGVPLAEDDVDHLLGQIVQEQMAQIRHQEHNQMLLMQQQMAHMQQQHLVQMQHLRQMAQMQGGAQVLTGGPFSVPNMAPMPNIATDAAVSDAPADVLAGLRVHCPLRTKLPHSCQEETAVRNGNDIKSVGEIKAYKLGKKRWSYNQVDVVLKEKGGKRELFSKQAIHKGVAASNLMDMAGITYQVTLNNDEVIQVHTFLVYEDGKERSSGGDASGLYEWELVNRERLQAGMSRIDAEGATAFWPSRKANREQLQYPEECLGLPGQLGSVHAGRRCCDRWQD